MLEGGLLGACLLEINRSKQRVRRHLMMYYNFKLVSV